MADRRTNRDEWQKRVERWKESGLTAKEFAAEMGLNVGTLQFWKYKLRKGDSRSSTPRARALAKPTASSLVEVSPVSIQTIETRFEIELGNGRRVRVPASFDVAALRRLVVALEAAA